VTGERVTDERVTDERVTGERVTDERVTDERVTDERVTDERVTDERVTGERVTGDVLETSLRCGSAGFGPVPAAHSPPRRVYLFATAVVLRAIFEVLVFRLIFFVFPLLGVFADSGRHLHSFSGIR
jgi:hypothetical protein